MLHPVSRIPREVLVVVNKVGFDGRSLLNWLFVSTTNPLTREMLSRDVVSRCATKVLMHLKNEFSRNRCNLGHYGRLRDFEILRQKIMSSFNMSFDKFDKFKKLKKV